MLLRGQKTTNWHARDELSFHILWFTENKKFDEWYGALKLSANYIFLSQAELDVLSNYFIPKF